jgi:hypothetical protein
MCDSRLKTPAFSAKWDEQMSVNYVFAAGINYAGLFAGHDERRRAPAPDRKSVTKLYRYLCAVAHALGGFRNEKLT